MSFARGDVVVCIVASGDGEALVRCLASVVEHTPPDVPVLVAGPADLDALPARARSRLVEAGDVPTLQAAAGAAGPADVCVVDERVIVATGWLDGLRDALGADTLVATSTALSNHAAFLSLPLRNRPWRGLPQEWTLDAAAARVREQSLLVRPSIPVALGHCVLVRRSALDLAGPLDDVTAFSRRCVERGLRHVAADDVLVLHAAAADAPADVPGDVGPDLGALLAEARDDAVGPLGRALTAARQALTGRRVTIDGRSLGAFRSGTQTHTLELIAALARSGSVRVRVILPPEPGAYAVEALAALDGVETVGVDASEVGRDEVVHRPFQVARPSDVADLARFGERVVLTQQDLIGFRTPGYFETTEAWLEHRRLTREALAFADLALFFSAHARDDALAADLVAPSRARVVHIGVDHAVAGSAPAPRRPAGAPDGPFLLCLGTSFRHKNRPFAIRVLAALRAGHGWDGRLVLAGPEVADGSSAAEEAALALELPDAAGAVVRLGAVDEDEKAWLYEHADAVLYPTVYEGFGLVPFEAAAAGTPCFWAPQSSLPQVLGDAPAVIVPWDAEATAAAAIGHLRDPAPLVDAVRAAAGALTWDRTAEALLAAYDETLHLPARESAVLARAEMVTQSAYWGLRHDIGDTGMALVGPGDPLLPLETQRALAALASRDATRSVLFRLLDRLGRRA